MCNWPPRQGRFDASIGQWSHEDISGVMLMARQIVHWAGLVGITRVDVIEVRRQTHLLAVEGFFRMSREVSWARLLLESVRLLLISAYDMKASARMDPLLLFLICTRVNGALGRKEDKQLRVKLISGLRGCWKKTSGTIFFFGLLMTLGWRTKTLLTHVRVKQSLSDRKGEKRHLHSWWDEPRDP